MLCFLFAKIDDEDLCELNTPWKRTLNFKTWTCKTSARMWLFNNAYWLADDDAVLVYKLRISAGLANEASIVSAAQCWCWGRPCQLPPAQTPDNPKYVGNPAASSLGAPPTKVSFLMDGWIVHLYYLLHHVALSLDISAFPAAAAEASTKLIFDQHPRHDRWEPCVLWQQQCCCHQHRINTAPSPSQPSPGLPRAPRDDALNHSSSGLL